MDMAVQDDFFDYVTLKDLSLVLDPKLPVGNDWRMFACKLGFTTLEITTFNGTCNGKPTEAILHEYRRRTAATGQEMAQTLLNFAIELEREDVVKILKKYQEAHSANTDTTVTIDDEMKEDQYCYYGRLCYMVLMEGTERMRHYLLNHLPSGTKTIEEAVNMYNGTFKVLREKDVLTLDQYRKLFPSSHRIKLSNFGISLLYLVIKTLTVEKGIKWAQMPTSYTLEGKEFDVMRLVSFQEEIYHSLRYDMQLEEFERLFRKIADVLKRMGTSEENLYSYKTVFVNISSEVERARYVRAIQQLEEQYMRCQMQVTTPVKRVSQWVKLAVSAFTLAALIALAVVFGVKYNYAINANKPAERKVYEDCNLNYVSVKTGNAHSFYLMRRWAWGGINPTRISTPLYPPLKYVVIAHTAGPRCTESNQCCKIVRGIQKYNMPVYDDIQYNFLIGEDGKVYEGRGWDIEGAHSVGWNDKAYGIGFIGNFNNYKPHRAAIAALRQLLQFAEMTKKITSDYVIYNHCQIRPFESPGIYTRLEIEDLFKHWAKRNISLTDLDPKVSPTAYCLQDQIYDLQKEPTF